MERILTAFVSSTYLDLVLTRAKVQQNCLHIGVMPLGMEFFPSTGVSQWTPITECIDDSDFCIFILAGKYGSIDEGTGLSWTHKEFRYAVEMKKPTIVLLRSNLEGLPVHASERDPARIDLLSEFHREVRGQECVLWQDEEELLVGMYRSIDYLKRQKNIRGWTKAGTAPSGAQDVHFSRHNELIESHSRYTLSPTNPRLLDMEHHGHRIIRCTASAGMSTINLNWTKNTDSHSAFDPTNPPKLELISCDRSSSGRAYLEKPRKLSGSSFAVDIHFEPALRFDEVVEFRFKGYFPNYRFATAQDTKEATRSDPNGERNFDYAAWSVSFPLHKLVYSVEFPIGIGIAPLGPRSGYGNYLPAGGPDHNLNEEYSYSEIFDEDLGLLGRMVLTVRDGKHNCNYRMAWKLP